MTKKHLFSRPLTPHPQSLTPRPSSLLPYPFSLLRSRMLYSFAFSLTSYGISSTKEQVRKNKLFLQNEPKSQKVKFNVNKVLTKDYDQMDTWSIGKKQSQTNPNKAKSCPPSVWRIKAKMNVTAALTKEYENKPPIRAPKKQSQTLKRQKPMQTSLPKGIMKKTALLGPDKTKPNKPNACPPRRLEGLPAVCVADQRQKCCRVCRLAFLLEIMTNNSYISFLGFVFCSVGGSLKRSLGMVLAGYALRDTRYKKWLYV